MKFELRATKTFDVKLSELELVPADADVWKGLLLEHQSKLDPELTEDHRSLGHDDGLTLDEIAFEENWLGEVTRTATDLLWCHSDIIDQWFYLGYYNEDNKPVAAVYTKEMDNFGPSDITYTGWRVKVTCVEADWDVE